MDSGVALAGMLREVRGAFEKACLGEAAQDARVLVAGLLGLTPTELVLQEKRVLLDDEVERVRAGLERRLAGEPVYRILGERSFYGLPFKLSSETLEPRADTEALVETVLNFCVDRSGSYRILDLGTGTGAIVLTLLHELPSASGVGLDISQDAVTTARQNAAQLQLAERFSALQSDWFEAAEGLFDIVVSNPPYIDSGEIGKLSKEVRNYDPVAALDGGPDGLAPYRIIAREVSPFLKPSGFVAVEIGWQQRESVCRIFTQDGFFLEAEAKDLGGNDRVLLFKRR